MTEEVETHAVTTDEVAAYRARARLVLRSLIVLAVATAVLYGLVAYVAFANQRALCTFRDDLITRIASSQKFLKDHPKGAFGFTPQQIRDGITNQRRTIDALDGLRCL